MNVFAGSVYSIQRIQSLWLGAKRQSLFLINNGNKLVDEFIVDDCLLKLRIREEKCDYYSLFKKLKQHI